METIARYLDAIHEIDAADRELDEILELLSTAGRTMPRRCASDAASGHGADSGHGERHVADFAVHIPSSQKGPASGFPSTPTIEEITRALSRMHRAYDAAENAWANVEPEFRDRLSPPPKRFSNDHSS